VRNAISTDGKLKAFEPKTGIPLLNRISIHNVIKQLECDWIEDTGLKGPKRIRANTNLEMRSLR
jgi:hypothetical protein